MAAGTFHEPDAAVYGKRRDTKRPGPMRTHAGKALIGPAGPTPHLRGWTCQPGKTATSVFCPWIVIGLRAVSGIRAQRPGHRDRRADRHRPGPGRPGPGQGDGRSLVSASDGFSRDDAVDAIVDFTGCEEAAREAGRRFFGRIPVLAGQGSRLVARLAGCTDGSPGTRRGFAP
jgi:hypothetical protein